MKKGMIYCITNKANGKQYVGYTFDFDRRMERHRNPSKSTNIALHRAIIKYGWDSFFADIIHYDVPEFQIKDLEKYWIRKLRTYENGYNMTLGGDGALSRTQSESTRQKISKSKSGKPAHNRGKPMSDEQKEKLSKLKTGYNHSDYSKQKVSNSLIGNKRALGFKHSKETRRKLSKVRTGRGNHFYGKKHTAESKRKQSESIKSAFLERDLRRSINKVMWRVFEEVEAV